MQARFRFSVVLKKGQYPSNGRQSESGFSFSFYSSLRIVESDREGHVPIMPNYLLICVGSTARARRRSRRRRQRPARRRRGGGAPSGRAWRRPRRRSSAERRPHTLNGCTEHLKQFVAFSTFLAGFTSFSIALFGTVVGSKHRLQDLRTSVVTVEPPLDGYAIITKVNTGEWCLIPPSSFAALYADGGSKYHVDSEGCYSCS